MPERDRPMGQKNSNLDDVAHVIGGTAVYSLDSEGGKGYLQPIADALSIEQQMGELIYHHSPAEDPEVELYEQANHVIRAFMAIRAQPFHPPGTFSEVLRSELTPVVLPMGLSIKDGQGQSSDMESINASITKWREKPDHKSLAQKSQNVSPDIRASLIELLANEATAIQRSLVACSTEAQAEVIKKRTESYKLLVVAEHIVQGKFPENAFTDIQQIDTAIKDQDLIIYVF